MAASRSDVISSYQMNLPCGGCASRAPVLFRAAVRVSDMGMSPWRLRAGKKGRGRAAPPDASGQLARSRSACRLLPGGVDHRREAAPEHAHAIEGHVLLV